ncbi:GGDEF domain-containing protein [Pelomonas sp. KK5]|uniref:GGDEF domain-containing protein n=1 Tax=Pelomonas sp. KK5 TaxID=1855730 RepID=UPI00097C4556|nr:GGDEF domain-containing protein [Pelomonas sp. KK5]
MQVDLQDATDEQDSAVVRSTFRLLVQQGVLLGLAMALLHSLFFWQHGDPNWRFTAAIGLAMLPLYPLTGMRRSYPVFLAALLGFLALAIAALSVQSLRYGRDASFHLVLLALAPAILVAGRIGMKTKWLLALGVSLLVLWLDGSPGTSLQDTAVSPVMLGRLRLINLAILLFTLCALVQRYFIVIVRVQRRLMEFASIDPLTGLFNRRHFMATAAQELARSERYGGSLCVALADLDHFKSINDRFGHEVGDAVLRHVSHLIRNVARNADCVCRWGGEEFIVLLPQTALDGAESIAERIRQQVSDAPLQLSAGGEPLHVTMTLGVAMLNPGEAFDNAVRRADKALYAGKAAGRNRAVLAPAA